MAAIGTEGRSKTAGVEKLPALFSYWRSKSDGVALPARRDIDPVEVPRHLSTLLLIDGVDGRDGGRPRFRLVGTALSRVLVRDPTGRRLDEVLDDSELVSLSGVLGHVATEGMPAAVPGRLVWGDDRSAPVDWLFLPLAGDGRTVDMILGCADLPPLPLRLPQRRARFHFSWQHPVRPGAWTPWAAPTGNAWAQGFAVAS